MQSTATIAACSPIMSGLMPSIRSLNETSSSVGKSAIPTEKTNLPQRICSRRSGNRPSTQKLRPSSESRGKMNRLVNVERISAVTERFRKLTRFRHEGDWTA